MYPRSVFLYRRSVFLCPCKFRFLVPSFRFWYPRSGLTSAKTTLLMGARPRGRTATQRSEKDSEKVLGKASQKGSEKGACYGFTVKKGSEKGF